jgi:NADPH:quinone reductase-like Zn-dependent oxidoreductase
VKEVHSQPDPMMKAIILNHYGDEHQLKLIDVKKPEIKKPNDVLIQVHVANISSGDHKVNALAVNSFLKFVLQVVFGFGKPRAAIRGIAGSGQVVAIGSKVTAYRVGDRVNFINSMGASVMAEFLLLNDRSVMAPFDTQVEYSVAAPVAFGAMTADYFINEKTIKPNQRVLIYGASGSVGTYAVALAQLYGSKVTAIASSKHHDVLRSLQPVRIIDYQTPAFLNQTETYDVILDAVGFLPNHLKQRLLLKGGRFFSIKQVTKESSLRLAYLNGLLAKGQLTTILDRVYPLTDFQTAHRHVYEGHKTGNVVLSMVP